MTMRTFTAEVDVSLSDFDDDEIEQEAMDRGFILSEPENIDEDDVVEMFYAFKFGKEDRATELAKKIASDYMGRIL